MGNRIFVGLVLLLWTGTMSWLMMARILPLMFHGEPPGQGTLVRGEPICWEIQYDEQPVGHAVSQAVAGALGTTEIHSRVQLQRIDVRNLAPQWMGTLVRGLGEISVDTRNSMVLDSLGNLSSFDTRVWINDFPLVMRVLGRVQDADLLLRIQTGDMTHEAKYPAPSHSLLASELIPDPKLLHVYVGRKWQQKVYSPFRPLSNSLEIVHAEVVEETWLEQPAGRFRTKKIEYRTLSPAGVAADNTLRAVVWVAEDGVVLRQDLYLMNAKLRFERRTEPHMLALARELLDLDSVATLPPSPSHDWPQ